jgi:xanthine/uracil permease
MPIAVGLHFGMPQLEIAQMLQRSFFIFGITSSLQVKFGHRYPIIDGPAGLWTSMILIMASSIAGAGQSMAVLRTDIELGVIVAGAVVILTVLLGLLKWLTKLFTPIVNGVIIITMVLQMSITLLRGVTGVDGENQSIHGGNMTVFFVTTAAILFVTIYMKGFLQSIATLTGVILGWLAAAAMGLWTAPVIQNGFFSPPIPLAWGMPTLNPGVMVGCVISGLLLMSMIFASINSMSAAVGEQTDERTLGRSMLLQGLATILTGIFPTVPPMQYISSTGVVLMTGVAARKPFLLACSMIILFSVISPVSLLLATMPTSVAYSTTIVIFALIFGQGLHEFRKCTIGNRESYIIGISMILGVGTMSLPSGAFSALPGGLAPVLSNGLVVATLSAMILERLLKNGLNE